MFRMRPEGGAFPPAIYPRVIGAPSGKRHDEPYGFLDFIVYTEVSGMHTRVPAVPGPAHWIPLRTGIW